MQTSKIRPGLLVSLKTTIRGGVNYQTQTLESDHLVGEARVAKWETRREIADAAEHARAVVARSACRTAVVRACCASSFGLLCPTENESALSEGVREARRVAAEFNASSRFSTIDVYVIAGRIAASDSEAAQAIGAEVRDLIAAMERGVRSADPVAIRKAASEAKQVAAMLSDDAKGAVSKAIEEVRKVARDIVARTQKAGETAASVVEGLKLEALEAARFAVLDMTQDDDTQATIGDAIAASAAPAIDLMPADDAQTAQDEPQGAEPAQDEPQASEGAQSAQEAAQDEPQAQDEPEAPEAPMVPPVATYAEPPRAFDF